MLSRRSTKYGCERRVRREVPGQSLPGSVGDVERRAELSRVTPDYGEGNTLSRILS